MRAHSSHLVKTNEVKFELRRRWSESDGEKLLPYPAVFITADLIYIGIVEAGVTSCFFRARMEDFMGKTDKKKENMVLMSMRICAEDKELIEEKARKTGLSTSEYMRRCALGRKLPCYGDTSLLKEYSMQLGKIGSNLNQIAKHLNGGGDFYSSYFEVKEAIREVLDLKFKILPALEDVACGKKRRRKSGKDGEA